MWSVQSIPEACPWIKPPLRTNRTHMYKRIKTLKMPTLSENGLVPWKALHTYAIGSKRRRRLHAAAATDTTPPPLCRVRCAALRLWSQQRQCGAASRRAGEIQFYAFEHFLLRRKLARPFL